MKIEIAQLKYVDGHINDDIEYVITDINSFKYNNHKIRISKDIGRSYYYSKDYIFFSNTHTNYEIKLSLEHQKEFINLLEIHFYLGRDYFLKIIKQYKNTI